MPSLFEIASGLDRRGFRGLAARAGSAMMRLRGDSRRFETDSHGRWLNRQPEATFVGPDLHTATYGQVEQTVLDSWCVFYTPGPGDVVVDVGAGIGEDIVIFSRQVGEKGRVIAIEAHPEIFAMLESTVRESGLRNVVAIQRAISDREGSLTIGNSSQHLANSVVAGNTEGLPVRAQSLDSLAEELGLERIDLLKMNIEGAERMAVLGMERIAPRVRNVAISCHDFVADGGADDTFRTREEVTRSLDRLGFETCRRADAIHPWSRDVVFGTRRS